MAELKNTESFEHKEFSSVKNCGQKYIDIFSQHESAKEEWLVLVKIHGANFQFFSYFDKKTDEVIVKAGKRTAFLSFEEFPKFFNCGSIVEKYTPLVKDLFLKMVENKTLKKEDTLTVYGELFGNYFPDPEDVKGSLVKQTNCVQKDVYYTKELCFWAFDILINGLYIDYDTAMKFLREGNIPYVQPSYRANNLKDALQWSDARKDMLSIIPKMFGLPDIENNYEEGWILKPVKPFFLKNGSRVILKNKNKKFNEVFRKPDDVKQYTQNETRKMTEQLRSYITPQRLDNVISKFGKPEKRDIPLLKNLLYEDALKDCMDTEEFENYDKLLDRDKENVKKLCSRHANDILLEFFKK